jgi:predicted lipid-binding transport protein (Tim44 family)
MTDTEIIIYAVIAIFFAYRLYTVLGKTNGDEKARAGEMAAFIEKLKSEKDRAKAGASASLDSKPLEVKAEEVPSHLKADVDAARKIDPAFLLSKFIEGASGAFEMVIKAFAEGKREALKFLLSKDIYDNFESELTKREAEGNVATHTIYSMQNPEVLDIEVKDNICQIVVKFVSEQFNYIKSRTGEIIEGSASEPEHVTDIWTFERDLTSKKPNWVVVGIQTA